MANAAEQIEEGLKHDAARRGPASSNRPVHTFQVPERLVLDVGYRSLGLVILTPEEEMMSSRRARNDAIRLAFEMPMQALREVDGKRVTLADNSAERAWEQMGPKGRQLVIAAYGMIHTPAAEDALAFLASRSVTVG